MLHDQFLEELRLTGKALSFILSDEARESRGTTRAFCTLAQLNDALMGETLCFSAHMKGCPGAQRGMGFFDGLPSIKGGFGNFIADGCKEGGPEGERIKKTAVLGEEMMTRQPLEVLGSSEYILVKPYASTDRATCVTFLCNPDQLSALIHLFCYRRSDYDSVIAPMSSGCASLFRIPFDEANKEHPRAVIGNVDLFSRVHFPENTFFLTIDHQSYLHMLEDADSSFLTAGKWKEVKARLHHGCQN